MVVDGQRHSKRPDAGGHLKVVVAQELQRQERRAAPGPPRVVGELGGQTLELSTRRDYSGGADALIRVGSTPVVMRVGSADLASIDALGLVSRLENRVRGLDGTLDAARGDLSRANREEAAARARLGAPFPHEQRLATVRARLVEIDAALVPEAAPPPGRAADADRAADAEPSTERGGRGREVSSANSDRRFEDRAAAQRWAFDHGLTPAATVEAPGVDTPPSPAQTQDVRGPGIEL